MHSFTAAKTTLRGKELWCVSLPASISGKRGRVYRATEREALAAARQFEMEHRKHGSEHAIPDLTAEERAFIMALRRDKIAVAKVAHAAKKIAAPKSKTLLECLNAYLLTQEGNSYGHIKSLKSCYALFAAAHPNRKVDEIQTSVKPRFLAACASKCNSRQFAGGLPFSNPLPLGNQASKTGDHLRIAGN